MFHCAKAPEPTIKPLEVVKQIMTIKIEPGDILVLLLATNDARAIKCLREHIELILKARFEKPPLVLLVADDFIKDFELIKNYNK